MRVRRGAPPYSVGDSQLPTERICLKQKKRGGFSYMEVLIALALFAIALTAVFPSLLQAARNMEFAEGYYRSHLLAQGMMLVVRDSLVDGSPQVAAADFATANEVERYSVWIFGQRAGYFSYGGVLQANVTLTGGAVAGHSTIVVVIWSEDGNMAGRAVGVLYG